MLYLKPSRLLAITATFLLSACGSYSGSSDPVSGGSGSGGNGSGAAKDEHSHFHANVASNLDFCRTCHVPGGVADTDAGRRLMLSTNKAQDYELLKASWTALGQGVEDNLILQNASGAHEHSGGSPWAKGSVPYTNMKILFGCWDNPVACASLLAGASGGSGPLLPLLGNADQTGHRFWATKFCEGKPDSTPVNWDDDPRTLMQRDGPIFKNPDSAVWVNDPWENCHTEALFENQARANAILVAKGKEPRHTAKRNPTSCGEYRRRAAEGFDFIARKPTSGDAGLVPASFYASLWKQWGLSERPDDFDAQAVERYGLSPSTIPNPYPIDAEETSRLSASYGGSGKLPLGWSQGRTEDGQYSGKLGVNCFICHAGRIGSGDAVGTAGNVASHPELAAAYGANPAGSFMGSPNSLQDWGLQINELLRAGLIGKTPLPLIGLPVNANTTRGTHAADDDIVLLYMLRDLDTLDLALRPDYLPRDALWLSAFGGSTGDQDSPAWWWTHNKARYLWFGAHSSDSSRGDMYFGAGANLQSGEWNQRREGKFDDVRLWHDSVEGPRYPFGFCSGTNGARQAGDTEGCIDRPRAEQGAVLFHAKNLWADGHNESSAKPEGGNGSCAGCHGAYSPRYANDPGYLPDPRLVGMASYTVPLDIIGTDRKQAENWTGTVRHAVSTIWNSYPDGMPDYKLPEEKLPGMETIDDLAAFVGGDETAGQLARQLQTLAGSLNIPGLGEALKPVVTLLELLPGVPLADYMGRVRGACSFQTEIIGYTAPPLHSVWASAPYFHNGSVPNVWEVLKPSDRKSMWKRREVPEGTTQGLDRGFDPNLDRALDFQNIGWKYDEVQCGATGVRGIPYYQCQAEPVIQWHNSPLKGVLDLVQGSAAWWANFEVPAVGQWQVETRKIQNTLLYGKSNRGHEFTEVLTDDERRALIEYLKTL